MINKPLHIVVRQQKTGGYISVPRCFRQAQLTMVILSSAFKPPAVFILAKGFSRSNFWAGDWIRKDIKDVSGDTPEETSRNQGKTASARSNNAWALARSFLNVHADLERKKAAGFWAAHRRWYIKSLTALIILLDCPVQMEGVGRYTREFLVLSVYCPASKDGPKKNALLMAVV